MPIRKDKDGTKDKYTWSSGDWERADRLKKIGTPEALEELIRMEKSLIEIDDDDDDEEG